MWIPTSEALPEVGVTVVMLIDYDGPGGRLRTFGHLRDDGYWENLLRPGWMLEPPELVTYWHALTPEPEREAHGNA